MDCALAVSLIMSTSRWPHATPYKIKVNWCIWWCELCYLSNFIGKTQIFWEIWPSIFASFDIRNMFPESHGLVPVPVTSSDNFVSLHQLDRDKLEHVNVKQLVAGIPTKKSHEHMRKWMVEIIGKSESRSDKIALVNSICTTKLINLL